MTHGGHRGTAVTVALAAALLLAACGDDGSNGGTSFEEALQDGATCQELFDIRNAADPDSPKIPEWNEQLREIGCFSSSSTRTDQ